MVTRARARPAAVAGLAGYAPLSALWEADEGRLFPSEQSARWFIRTHRAALVEADALAVHTGRMLVQRDRFAAVAEAAALAAARRRAL